MNIRSRNPRRRNYFREIPEQRCFASTRCTAHHRAVQQTPLSSPGLSRRSWLGGQLYVPCRDRRDKPGDDTVIGDAVWTALSFNTEFTLKLAIIFFYFPVRVRTPCLAQLRALHEAFMLRSKVWRPGLWSTQTRARVVSDHRPHPSQDGGCLRWLDVDRMKGGAG